MSDKLGENLTTEYGAQSYSEWDSKATYVQYQRVQKEGLIYAAKRTTIGVDPVTDSDSWELLGSMPLEQGEGFDTVVFKGDDKKQVINGKSITGTNPISVAHSANGNTISVAKATADSLGVVKAGTGVTIDDDGAINVEGSSYDLPIATADTLGGVKIGDNVKVADDGTLSIPTANMVRTGVVKVGNNLTSATDGTVNVKLGNKLVPGIVRIGDGINVDSSGLISVNQYELPTAGSEVLGGVKVGDGLSITDDGILSASGGSSSGGWETVSSEWAGSSTYFYANCYKNTNFILANVYANTSISAYYISSDTFSFTIDITTPFYPSNIAFNIMCLVAPTKIYGSIVAQQEYEFKQYDGKIQITAGSSYPVDLSNGKIILSVLIPYLEI